MIPQVRPVIKKPARLTFPPLFRTIPLHRRAMPGMDGSVSLTADHEEIRRWAESRGGRPAALASLLRFGSGDAAGALRIAFRDHAGREQLEEISWETFFKTFDARHLAFIYQEKTAGGEPSRFNKFIRSEAAAPERRRLKAA